MTQAQNNQTVYRRQWRGALKAGAAPALAKTALSGHPALTAALAGGGVLGLNIYLWEGNLFVYCEGLGAPPDPHDLLAPLAPELAAWPGKSAQRLWIEMMDVFHFNEPVSPEHWRRKAPVERRDGRLGVLKPECVSSYIYYHYGLQEERTFGGDKYEIISLHENILFGYFERPEVVETPPLPPRLTTKSMPENWKDARIPDHFIRWPDTQGCLRPIDLWFEVWA